MAANLYSAKWGTIPLYIEDIGTTGGRALVVHDPSSGDNFVVQDRGRNLPTASVTLCFCDVTTESVDPITRYRAFLAAVEDGEARVFVHPLRGAYLASVGEMSDSADAGSGEIRVTCQFVPADPFEPVDDVAAGVTPVTGPEAVETLATDVNDSIAATGAPSTTVATDAAALADEWASDDADPRRVILECSDQVAGIDDYIETHGIDSLSYWEVYRNLMLLRSKVVDVADAATNEVAQSFDYLVRASTPLLPLMARLYGPADAFTRAQQVADANDLRSPLMVTQGTVLKLPVTT